MGGGFSKGDGEVLAGGGELREGEREGGGQ